MDSKLEEEKKESAEKVKGDEDCGSRDGNGDGDEDEELEIDEELVDLPDELADLRDTVFSTERDLLDELDKRGLGDIRVVLLNDGTARQIMPSEQHNDFTSFYVGDWFLRTGGLGWCSGTHKVHLSNGRSRDPDISYWGYNRCDKHPTTGNPCFYKNDTSPIPDVVIQFSWRNSFGYERDAIEDMLSKGLEYEGGPLSTDRPRLGYLIKMRFSKKRKIAGLNTQDVAGLDIYRLPYGTTVEQALDLNNSCAEHWSYEPGDPEVLISIRREDLGIPSTFGSRFLRSIADLVGIDSGDVYMMKASEIYTRMHNLHAGRQKRGLAT
jgi:hypothetical protein